MFSANSGMGIIRENANFRGSETDFPRRKIILKKVLKVWKVKDSSCRVVNRCEKFDDCGCANKWEWISVNDSRIGLVGRRRGKPVGHLTLRLFVPAVKMLRNPKQYDEGHFTKEDQLSWK